MAAGGRLLSKWRSGAAMIPPRHTSYQNNARERGRRSRIKGMGGTTLVLALPNGDPSGNQVRR